MTMTVETPAQRNCIAWLDLGERIEEALTSLRALEARGGRSQRLREKIVEVEAAQREFHRMEAVGTPYLSLLEEWLRQRLAVASADNQRACGHGYSLVLDYTRVYY